MAFTQDNFFAGSVSRIILGATIATCVVAAVAASPSASAIMQSPATPAVKGSISVGGSDVVRPLAPGAGIRVGRAYGVEDEDCTIVFMPNKDARGRETYSRSVSCAD
jgi:hypothetical protein